MGCYPAATTRVAGLRLNLCERGFVMLGVKPRTLTLPVLACCALLGASLRAADAVKLTKLDDRIRVEVGGQHFTDYVVGDGASRSYCAGWMPAERMAA